MKNSSHVIIWGVMGIPITIGLFYILPAIIKDTTYLMIILLLWFCGFGFFIQGLLQYFEKKEFI